MPNLALGLLPLEPWNRPEDATDGKITDYTTQSGFAEAAIPCTYTLDFVDLFKVDTIRILLWDGKGRLHNTKNSRRYYFSLSVSTDYKNWETYFDSMNEGYSGWIEFSFPNKPEIRFVRLTGKHNTANDAFHIVEFEAYDQKPNILESATSEISRWILLEPLLDRSLIAKDIQEQYLKQNDEIEKTVKKALDQSAAIEKIRIELVGKVKEFNETIEGVNLAGKSLFFHQEATTNNNLASKWLISASISFVVFIGLICYFLFFNDYHYTEISKKVTQELKINDSSIIGNTIWMEFISFLLLKVLFISLSIYLIIFCVRNYKVHKHNFIVNQHKALSLFESLQYFQNEKLKDDTKEKILIQATNVIFSHQQTGYDDKSVEMNPNIITNVIDKLK